LQEPIRARRSVFDATIALSSMSKSKYSHSTLSGLIDSDDDDLQFAQGAIPTPDSANENRQPAKKGRGRPAMPNKVTKAKAPARRTSGRITGKVADGKPISKCKKGVNNGATGKGKRTILGDKTNQQDGNETEEVEDFDANEDIVMSEGEEAKLVAVKPKKAKSVRKKTTAPTTEDAMETAVHAHREDLGSKFPTKKSRVVKKNNPAKREVVSEFSSEKEIQETQAQDSSIAQDGMDLDGRSDEEEVIEETVAKMAPNRQRSRDDSRIHQTAPHRRVGSGSDTERSDPALRRKLGDITKRFESLNAKYQDLREIGLKEAERNFERLKRQSEEKTAGMLLTVGVVA